MSIEERRENLGKRVREVWVAWAKEQSNPKPDWLVPWEELPEHFKEVDRRIGSVIWGDAVAEFSEEAANAAMAAIEQIHKTKKGCQCLRCLHERGEETIPGWPIEMTRMIVCQKCGNKRCPHSDWHGNECTNSNEPGQPGSRYV